MLPGYSIKSNGSKYVDLRKYSVWSLQTEALLIRATDRTEKLHFLGVYSKEYDAASLTSQTGNFLLDKNTFSP